MLGQRPMDRDRESRHRVELFEAARHQMSAPPPNEKNDRKKLDAAKAMATDLDCAVLLKGRRTVVAMPAEHGHRAGTVRIIDAGTSWAATPGSGDVLSGLVGAWMAKDGMAGIAPAVTVHARAAEIAARTPAGYAPTSASLIAEAIREATAALAAETAWPSVAE